MKLLEYQNLTQLINQKQVNLQALDIEKQKRQEELKKINLNLKNASLQLKKIQTIASEEGKHYRQWKIKNKNSINNGIQIQSKLKRERDSINQMNANIRKRNDLLTKQAEQKRAEVQIQTRKLQNIRKENTQIVNEKESFFQSFSIKLLKIKKQISATLIETDERQKQLQTLNFKVNKIKKRCNQYLSIRKNEGQQISLQRERLQIKQETVIKKLLKLVRQQTILQQRSLAIEKSEKQIQERDHNSQQVEVGLQIKNLEFNKRERILIERERLIKLKQT